MKINIFTQYYYPNNLRLNEISFSLSNMGHSVNVITGLPDYETGSVPAEYKRFRRRSEIINGIKVRRLPIIARRKGFLFRTLNYASFTITSFLYALFCKKPDIDCIYAYQASPIFPMLAAIVLKYRTGKKLIAHCYDLWPESLKAWNVSEKSLVFKAVKAISSWIYRQCDTVAITSYPFEQYLIEVCRVEASKIVYLPQYAEDLYSKISGVFKDNECVDFLFAGNLGAVQDVDKILHAAAILRTDKTFCVHIVGDGSEFGNLKALAESLQLGELVKFYGRYPLEAMYDFYRMADCFLLTLRGGDFIGMTLPAKAQGYLCAGKPILAAIDGAGRDLIKDADCGDVVSAGDVEGLAEKMKIIIENFEQYKEKGLNGRRYYETNFTKDIFMNNLLTLLLKAKD